MLGCLKRLIQDDPQLDDLAHYRRSLTIDDSLRWKAHRGRAYLRRRVLGWVKELKLVRAAYTPVARALVRGG